MIIVCDTNVLVSALAFPGGVPDKILRAVFSGRLEHATSPDILTELRKVLKKVLGVEDKTIESLVKFVAESSRLVYPTERLHIIKEDESDNRILECAVTAKADFLITGDKKHLLPIKKYHGTAIVSPRDFFLLAGLL